MVTLWLLSTDNLIGRSPEELKVIFGVSEDVAGQIAATGCWRVHPVGALDLLPASTARRLKELEDASRDVKGLHVNIAIGYGGRREIADAVRSLLQSHAAQGTRSRSWPRSWTSSTLPSTSTPGASRTRTW